MGEVITPDPVALNKTAKIKDLGISAGPKKILARSLGPHVRGVVPPMADSMDQDTLLKGAEYRFGRGHPAPRAHILAQLRAFVRKFARKHLDPIKLGTVSLTEYVEQTHYSRKYKDRLLELASRMGEDYPIIKVYKSFGKTERFKDGTKYKHVRCINPPPDSYKVYAAPYLHAVEKAVCKLKWFAKYIPVIERPQYIVDNLGSKPGPYYCTDYTSFESSFSPEVIDAIEGELYSYMLGEYPERADFINNWNSGKHNCRFKQFSITVDGVRMSGDPNTSLGNGFSNLMLTAFMCYRQGISFEGLVEGDDGLLVFSGTPDFSEIAQLGFQLKLEAHETIYTTSFCGLMLSQSLAAFADPRYVIAAFGWSHSPLKDSHFRIRMGLLRSKAISLMYCNPRCPLLTSLAKRFIFLTRHFTAVKPVGYWENLLYEESQKYSEAMTREAEKGISMADRIDFDNMYSIPVNLQVEIEKYFDNMQIEAIDNQAVDSIYGDDHWAFRDFSAKFTGTLKELL